MTGTSSKIMVGAVAVVVSSCVLFVDPPEPSAAHCAFAGADTDCGRCVAARCSSEVDRCCDEGTCGGIVRDLDRCAGAADRSACERLLRIDDEAHRTISTCIAGACASACGPPPGEPTVHCRPAYATSVEACTCELDAVPHAVTRCTAVGHPKLRCCAPDAWPGPALACDCLAVVCVPIGDGCVCQLTAMDDRGRGSTCNGAICCVDPLSNQCACGTQACIKGERQVASCGPEALACPTGRRPVDACSAP